MIYSIQQSLTQRREDDISRIVLRERLSRSPSNASDQAVSAIIEQFHKNTAQKEDSILTKLEALLANNSGKKSDEQNELTLFSKLNELLNKAQGSTGDSPKQLVEPLAAYSDTERRGTPDYKQRRKESGNYPPRSGYNQPQRRDDLPCQNPRSSHLAAIDGQGYGNDEIAPLGQNHHTFPQGEHEFLGMDFGGDDAQADEELYQQYQNGSRFSPATARYDEAPENEPTSALLSALKKQLSACPRTAENAYANDGI